MPVTTCPAILIAAPASGQGKTTVACALARLHTRAGRRVRVFKCGPDFLDPHWLTLASIAAHVTAGKPVWAECGGMMALFDELTALDGTTWPMWGVLPGKVTLQKRLAALGPQQLEVGSQVLRGHTFHYSTCATTMPALTRTQAAPGRKLRGEGEALYVFGSTKSVRASYFHAWFASNPLAAAHLFLKDDHD